MHFHHFPYNLNAVFLDSHIATDFKILISNHLFDILIAHSHHRFNMYKTSIHSANDTIFCLIQAKNLAESSLPLPVTYTLNHLVWLILPCKCISSAPTSSYIPC